ncbi:MAG: hypothetical protein ABIP74_02890 [Candidatus Saccharimonas sp.]
MSRLGNVLRVTLAATLFSSVVGSAALVSTIPAEAHQGTIKVVKTECVDGNTMKATFQWSWNSVPSNSYGTKVVRKTGTTSFEGNWGGSGGSSLVTVNSATGDTTWTETFNKSQFSGSNGPWEYVYAPWSDGYAGNRFNDTRVEGFNWDTCKPPKPVDVTDHQKFEKCDLSSYGDFKPGIIERDGVATYSWNGEKWILGDTAYNKWAQTKVYTDDEYFTNCAGQPEPDKVVKTYGEWTGAPDCVHASIFQTREVVTVTTKKVWNLEQRMYVWGEPVTTTTSETAKESIKLTDEQIRQCHKVDVPTVTVLSQTCKVGDQGVGQKTAGSIIVPKSVNYTVFIDGVTDATKVEPGTYPVKLTMVGLQSWSALPGGWSYLDKTHTTIVLNVTVGAAEGCTILKPPPDPSTFEWGQEVWKCGDINAITNGLRIDFVPTWVDGKWAQVAQAPVAVSSQRVLTELEITKVCTPAPKVEFASSEWKDDTVKCGDTKATQTRYTAKWEIPLVIQWNEDGTYSFVPNYDAKVLLSNTKETQTRDLKSSEITTCSGSLAYTGAGPWLWGIGIAGGIAVVMGIALVAIRRRGQTLELG